MKTAIYTISSIEYIPQAKAMLEAVAKYNPEFDQYHYLATGNHDGCERICDLNIPYYQAHVNRYGVLPAMASFKPFLTKRLLNDYEKVIYLDSDCMVYSSMEEVIKLLDTASMVLTPHITSPLPRDGQYPQDTDLTVSGLFNAGFFANSKCDESYKIMDWWEDFLHTHCQMSGHDFCEQRFLTLMPTLFRKVESLSLGYNVAYWNLHENYLKFDVDSEKWMINEQFPLVFFHYSGFALNNPAKISRYSSRHSFDTQPELRKLFSDYSQEIYRKKH